METVEPKRRRLRISLRVLMILVLVTGLWMGDRVNKARQQRAAVAAVKEYGGWVHFDWEFINGKLAKNTQPHAPKWLRKLLGDEYFQKIAHVSLVYDDSTGKRFDLKNDTHADGVLSSLKGMTSVKTLLMKGNQATDANMSHIGSLTNLNDLYVWDSRDISDAGLRHLRGLKSLKNIHLDNSKITDQGFLALEGNNDMERLVLERHSFTDTPLAIIKDMKRLECLSIGGSLSEKSNITDEGLIHLRSLKALEVIDLKYSQITDRGLENLKGLSKLRILELSGCNITDEGLRSISGLTNLSWLILSSTKITDSGLKHLAGLTKLTILHVNGTHVTDDGKRKFVESMAKYTRIR